MKFFFNSILLIVLITCTARPVPSQEQPANDRQQFLFLPDVTLKAADIFFLNPPPPVKLGIALLPFVGRERAQFQQASVPADISGPHDKIRAIADPLPANGPEPALAGIPVFAEAADRVTPAVTGTALEISYLTAWAARADLSYFQNAYGWDWHFKFSLGLADTWLAAPVPTASHFIFEADARGRFDTLALRLNSLAGTFFLPDSSLSSLVMLDKELTWNPPFMTLEERTVLYGWNSVADPSMTDKALEGLIGETVSLTGPGEQLRLAGGIRGFLLFTGLSGSSELPGAVGLEPLADLNVKLEWTPGNLPFILSGGGALLYTSRGLEIFPDGLFKWHLSPELLFFVHSGVYLELPDQLPLFLVNSSTDLLEPQGGYRLQTGFTLDFPGVFGLDTRFEYRKGGLYSLTEGLVGLEEVEQVGLAAGLSFSALPGLTLGVDYALGLSLPLQQAFDGVSIPAEDISSTLLGELRLRAQEMYFINLPLTVIVRSVWGMSPSLAFPSHAFERWAFFSGFILSLETIWKVNDRISWSFGVELLTEKQAQNFRFLLGYKQSGSH